MPLTQTEFQESLAVLFNPNATGRDAEELAESAAAFQNLAMHFIEKHSKWLIGKVAFDPVRLGLMLKRFYRDAFGVSDFYGFLAQKSSNGEISEKLVGEIRERVEGLSIRINTDDPRKTRIVAAFSLWFATLRPISILEQSPQPREP